MTVQFYIKTLCTPLDAFEIYKIVAKGEDCIFLDSSKRELPYGRYSIIGINPFLSVKYENNRIYEKSCGECFSPQDTHKNIFHYLKEKIQKYQLKNPTALPFVGGAIGYFSYDFGCRQKNITMPPEQIASVPDVYFIFYDNTIIFDHSKGQAYVTGLGILQDAKESADALIFQIKNNEYSENKYTEKNEEFFEKPIHKPFLKSRFSDKDYIKAIEKMQYYINKGDIHLANMTHTFSGVFQNNPLSTYENLRRINPAPFSAYLPLDGFYVLCSSPERFLKVRNKNVETRPIKGTVPRGQTPIEDEINRHILENSEKDKAELAMITKLEENDLRKVCKPDTVKVSDLFKIETFATVFHFR